MRAASLRRARTPALLVVLIAVAFVGAGVLYSAASAAIAPDNQPPSRPGVPVAVSRTPTSVTLTWAPSTDNLGVVRYQVDTLNLNSTRSVASTTNSVTFTKLVPGGYVFAVTAFDAAGNQSPYSRSSSGIAVPFP